MQHARYASCLRDVVVWGNGPFGPRFLATLLGLFFDRHWHGWYLAPTKRGDAAYRRARACCRKYKEFPRGGTYFRPASLRFKKCAGPCPFGVTAFYIDARE